MLRAKDLALASPALSFCDRNDGIAIAARMPMIRITTRSSMSVKPLSSFMRLRMVCSIVPPGTGGLGSCLRQIPGRGPLGPLGSGTQLIGTRQMGVEPHGHLVDGLQNRLGPPDPDRGALRALGCSACGGAQRLAGRLRVARGVALAAPAAPRAG